MKLLLMFLFLCFFIGTIWERKTPRDYLLPVVAVSVLLAAGYFFFNQS